MSPKHWFYIVPLRLRSIFHRRQVENELDEELQYHVEMKVEENIAKGMSSEEARRSALMSIGGLDQKKEECRDARGLGWLEDLQRNFRLAFRRMAKSPLLSVVIVLSLGLGIGANTAIFSAIYQIFLRPLPVEKPEEIAMGTTPGAVKERENGPSSTEYVFSYLQFREFARQQKENVAEFAGVGSPGFGITGPGKVIYYENQKVYGSVLGVSGGYFPTLRLRPILGRTLIPADDQEAGSPVAMFGYSFWKNKLGGGTDVLNKPIRINRQIFTVVGVAPKGFYDVVSGMSPDVIIPLATATSISSTMNRLLSQLGLDRHFSWIFLLARIRPGVTRQQVAALYAGLYAGSVEEQIQAFKGSLIGGEQRYRQGRLKFIDASRGVSMTNQDGRTPIIILMAGTGLVLLIAMANAANLLLARSAARRGELAICAAMGAGRSRILGQLLSEAIALAIAGGVVAIPISLAAIRFLILILGQTTISEGYAGFLGRIPTGFLTVQLEWPVLIYGLVLSVIIGLLFGLYPALEAARIAPIKVINQESANLSEIRGSLRVQKSLVCAQVILSMVVLIPTGLFLKSLTRLLNTDLGLRAENLIMFNINTTANQYTSEQRRVLYERAEQELTAVPGVTGVTMRNRSFGNSAIQVEGYAGQRSPSSGHDEISPGFFKVMGIPLVAGREFTDRDNRVGRDVAIVNEKFAKTFFAGQNPIGRKIGFRMNPVKPSSGRAIGMHSPIPETEIVGVAKDYSLSAKQGPSSYFYTPWRQSDEPGFMTFYVRYALPLTQVLAQIRRVVIGLDASIVVDDLWTMEDQVKMDLSSDWQAVQIIGIIAAVATALAMIGLYGVMAYSIIRRTREIGIRMAIGAKPTGIQKMIFRETLLIIVIGLALGIPAALALSKVVQSQLFGVSAFDPLVVTCASLALALASFAAAYLPAWRASRVDPLSALRVN